MMLIVPSFVLANHAETPSTTARIVSSSADLPITTEINTAKHSIATQSSTTDPENDSEAIDTEKPDPARTINARGVSISAPRRLDTHALEVTTIDSLTIARTRTATLAELLGLYTPLYIKSNGLGSTATASFRGTAPSHTTVEWNGIPINSPMVGQVDLSLLPAGFVDRVELLHGGSSLGSSSGSSSGALGGTVALSSLPNWGKRLYGGYTQALGSFGQLGSYATLGGGGGRLHYKVRYMWEQARNDYEYLNTAIPPFERTRQQNANYRKQGAAADLYFRPNSRNTLTMNLWWHTAYRNLPPVMSYEGSGRTENQQDNELRAVLKWNRYGDTRGGGSYKSELLSSASLTNMDYLLSNLTELGTMTNIDSRSQSRSLVLKYRFEWSLSPLTILKFNADGMYHNVSTNDAATRTGYSAHRTDLGLSASLHQRLVGETLSGYLLLRQEASIGTDGQLLGTPFIPSLGLELAPIRTDRDFTLRLSATRNYHRPTLNDLYWIPGGNPDLLPERGYTADLGAHYKTTTARGVRLKADLTGYLSMIDNWIIWRPGEYSYWSAENLRTVLARGIESSLRADYTLPASGINLAVGGNYTLTRTTNQTPTATSSDASHGAQLIYIPKHKATVMLDVNYRGLAWIGYRWNYTSERYTTSSNEAQRFSLPAYGLSDLVFGGSIPLWRTLTADVQLTIANLFDKDYQTTLWRAAAPRNYNIQISIKF